MNMPTALHVVDEALDSLAVAQLLNVKRESIHRYINRGSIPRPDFYVGRTPLWHKATVEKYIAAKERQHTHQLLTAA